MLLINKDNKRIEWADYAKAFGIFLMLLGHNELANKGLFDWIYTFHMPLFFIMAGYFTSENVSGFGNYVKKNARQLLIPYVFFYILTLPFGLYIIYSHQYNHPFNGPSEFLLKPVIGLFLVKTTDISFHTNGPSWFFVALFISKILFYANIKWHFRKSILIVSNIFVLSIYFALVLLGVDCYCRFTTALLGFPFLTAGYLLKKNQVFNQMNTTSKLTKMVIAISCFLLCMLAVRLNGHVEFSSANYGNNILTMYLGGIIGTIGVVAFSQIASPMSKGLLFVGGNTGIILGLHSMVQTSLRFLLFFSFGIPVSGYPVYLAIITSLSTILISRC